MHPVHRQAISKHEPVYQALWAQNIDFDEVLISPVMIQDHMPDKVLEALNKVRPRVAPTNSSTMTLIAAEHLPSTSSPVVEIT